LDKIIEAMPTGTAGRDAIALPADLSVSSPVGHPVQTDAASVLISGKNVSTSIAAKALGDPTRRPVNIAASSGNPEAARSGAPLAREANGDLLLFWTDAHEVRVNGGEHLYLFGKAPVDSVDSGVFTSVCIQVRGIDRALFVLPREKLVGPDGHETEHPVDN
jgi:hypothetical protein